MVAGVVLHHHLHHHLLVMVYTDMVLFLVRLLQAPTDMGLRHHLLPVMATVGTTMDTTMDMAVTQATQRDTHSEDLLPCRRMLVWPSPTLQLSACLLDPTTSPSESAREGQTCLGHLMLSMYPTLPIRLLCHQPSRDTGSRQNMSASTT